MTTNQTRWRQIATGAVFIAAIALSSAATADAQPTQPDDTRTTAVFVDTQDSTVTASNVAGPPRGPMAGHVKHSLGSASK